MLIYLEADFDLGENDCIDLPSEIEEDQCFEYIVNWLKNLFDTSNLELNINENTALEDGMTVKITTIEKACKTCANSYEAYHNRHTDCIKIFFVKINIKEKLKIIDSILEERMNIFEEVIGEGNAYLVKNGEADSVIPGLEKVIVDKAPEKYVIDMLVKNNKRDLKDIFSKESDVSKIGLYLKAGYKTSSVENFNWERSYKSQEEIMLYVNSYTKSTFEGCIKYMLERNDCDLFIYFLQLKLYEEYGKSKEDSTSLIKEYLLKFDLKEIKYQFLNLIDVDENTNPLILDAFCNRAGLSEIQKYLENGNAVDKLILGDVIYELPLEEIKILISKNIRMPDRNEPICFRGNIDFLKYFTSLGYNFADSVLDSHLLNHNYRCVTFLLFRGLQLQSKHFTNALKEANSVMVDYLVRKGCPRVENCLSVLMTEYLCSGRDSEYDDGPWTGLPYYTPSIRCDTAFCCPEEYGYKDSELKIFAILKKAYFEQERNKPYFFEFIDKFIKLKYFVFENVDLFPAYFEAREIDPESFDDF